HLRARFALFRVGYLLQPESEPDICCATRFGACCVVHGASRRFHLWLARALLLQLLDVGKNCAATVKRLSSELERGRPFAVGVPSPHSPQVCICYVGPLT